MSISNVNAVKAEQRKNIINSTKDKSLNLIPKEFREVISKLENELNININQIDVIYDSIKIFFQSTASNSFKKILKKTYLEIKRSNDHCNSFINGTRFFKKGVIIIEGCYSDSLKKDVIIKNKLYKVNIVDREKIRGLAMHSSISDEDSISNHFFNTNRIESDSIIPLEMSTETIVKDIIDMEEKIEVDENSKLVVYSDLEHLRQELESKTPWATQCGPVQFSLHRYYDTHFFLENDEVNILTVGDTKQSQIVLMRSALLASVIKHKRSIESAWISINDDGTLHGLYNSIKIPQIQSSYYTKNNFSNSLKTVRKRMLKNGYFSWLMWNISDDEKKSYENNLLKKDSIKKVKMNCSESLCSLK